MKKTPLIIFAVIIVAALILFFYKKPIIDTIAQQRYGSEINKLSQTIAEKKCQAGDEVYISLAQDYTYIKDFKKALSIYENMGDCYPGAYKSPSEKYKLLWHNMGALYEDWGYYLENTVKDVNNAEKKYQEAIKIFKNLVATLDKTEFITPDEIESYTNRIEQIEKYHLGK